MSNKLQNILNKVQSNYKVEIKPARESGVVEKLTLDSCGLNYVFGGGMPLGRLLYIQGPESGGKSAICTYLATQVQKKYTGKNTVVYLDYEYTFDSSHAEEMGLNLDENFILIRPTNGEDGFNMIKELVESGEVGLVILDSISAVSSKSACEDTFSGFAGSKNAIMVSSGLRMIIPYLYNNKCSMVIISQERSNVGCVDKDTLIYCVDDKADEGVYLPIREVFKRKFDLDYNTMEVDKVYDVRDFNANIGTLDLEGNLVKCPIVHAVKKSKRKMYKLSLDNGGINIRVSQDHLFAVRRTGDIGWVSASDIFEDRDNFKYPIVGQFKDLKLVDIQEDGEDYPLDIEVEGEHSYLSNFILSHNSMYGPDYKGTGGKAPAFYSSWSARVTRSADITDKDKGLIGIEMKIRNTKNKVAIAKREAVLKLYFNKGIDSDDEYCDYLKALGLITQKGAYYSNPDWVADDGTVGMKVCGIDAVKEWLKKNPNMYEKVKQEVTNAILGYTILDENTDDSLEEDENGEINIPYEGLLVEDDE